MSIGHEAKAALSGGATLTEFRAASDAHTILLFYQEANPKKRQAEEKQQREDDPAVRGNPLCNPGRIGRAAKRTPEACMLRVPRRVGLNLRSRRRVAPRGLWRHILCRLSGLWKAAQACSAVTTDECAHGILLPAIATRDHAWIYYEKWVEKSTMPSHYLLTGMPCRCLARVGYSKINGWSRTKKRAANLWLRAEGRKKYRETKARLSVLFISRG
jgi:hypothetical protein